MHTLAMHNIIGIPWQIYTYTDPQTKIEIRDGQANSGGIKSKKLSLRTMLTNIYNEDSYLEEADGRWSLSEELGNDYLRLKPEVLDQHTTCKSY
jgi:hypothetical protein